MKPEKPALRSFFLLAFGLTWVLLGPWFYLFNVVNQGEMSVWLWAMAPLAFIGGWGPSVAAVIVTAHQGGRSAVRRLLVSLADWRVRYRWYLFVFLIPPLATALSILIADQGFTTIRHFNLVAALAGIPLIYAIALPFGPLGEEVGWRGFALPNLLTRFGPGHATLILGTLWTLWHLPMMLWMPGASVPSFMGLSVMSVLIYLVQVMAVTAIMTFLFLRTNGSILLAVLAHLAFNTAQSVVFGGLPEMPVDQVRTVYVINVCVLAALGLVCMLWSSRRPPPTSLAA